MKLTPMQILKRLLANLGDRNGFSLVEMAIMLVVIGIVVGAIVKGQDLIVNSRAKQVTAVVSNWRNLAMVFFDRNGRFPGDEGKNGVIGDQVSPQEQTAATSANNEIKNSMMNVPSNNISVGSLNFWIYFGNIPGASGGRNVIAICKSIDCSSSFNSDEIEIIKAIDTALDGSADAGAGQFRAIKTTALTLSADNSVVTGGTAQSVLSTGAAATWAPSDHYAAVWAFDRPF